MKIEYHVVTASYATTLSRDVMALLDVGWTLVGGVTVVCAGGAHNLIWAQALSRVNCS